MAYCDATRFTVILVNEDGQRLMTSRGFATYPEAVAHAEELQRLAPEARFAIADESPEWETE